MLKTDSPNIKYFTAQQICGAVKKIWSVKNWRFPAK